MGRVSLHCWRWQWAPRTLTFIDELGSAERLISDLVQEAQASGSALIYSAASELPTGAETSK